MDIDTINADRAAVNAVIRSGKPVLMHWYDMDEEVVLSEDGSGIKYKYPIEVQRFAVGVLTGLPIYDEPWGERHTKWFLPVREFHACDVTTSKLRWEKTDHYPQNLGGTYPSLEAAEGTGYDPEVWRSIKDHRRAQIIVGADNIRAWLLGHEHFKVNAEKWFADIMCHSGAMIPA